MVIYQVYFVVGWGQVLVCIVFVQLQVVFGVVGEYVVWFVGVVGDQVIYQYVQVGFVVVWVLVVQFVYLVCGVEVGQQVLCGGFFIVGGVVDLVGEEQVVYQFGFQ